ncbi:MAG: FKBP-type peptidyl-prolyl cis-trans isomerase [Bacteroidales bacterium]|nr:FKBP-type peptidyl-prolyl cis-trans isomerase [Bacteroidales bacterium]
MKTLKTIALAAIAIIAAASCSNGQPKVDVPTPSKALTDSVSYLIGVNFGYFIKANGFGTEIDYKAVNEGMMDFINSEGSMNDPDFNDKNFRINPDVMNSVFGKYIEMVAAHESAVNKALGTQFLEKKANEDGVVTAESGLLYKVIEAGSELKAKANDKVCVKYKGTLIDGTEFDKFDGEDGLEMDLTRVIAGWTEGLQYVGEGGKIELYIPSELAYGERNMGTIKPGSTLVFDIEVVKVIPTPEAE